MRISDFKIDDFKVAFLFEEQEMMKNCENYTKIEHLNSRKV